MSLLETTYYGNAAMKYNDGATKFAPYFMFDVNKTIKLELHFTDKIDTTLCELSGVEWIDKKNIEIMKKYLGFMYDEHTLQNKLSAQGKPKIHYYKMKAEIEYLHNRLAISILNDLHTFSWLNFKGNNDKYAEEIPSPITISEALEIVSAPIKSTWQGYLKLLDMKYGIDISDKAFKNDIEEEKLALKNEMNVIKNQKIKKKND